MNYFPGIDIQIRRNCCYAVINANGTLIDSGWFESAESDAVFLVKNGPGPAGCMPASMLPACLSILPANGIGTGHTGAGIKEADRRDTDVTAKSLSAPTV